MSEYFPWFDSKVYGTNLYAYFKYLMFYVHSFVANIFYEGFQLKKGILVGQMSNSARELLMLTVLILPVLQYTATTASLKQGLTPRERFHLPVKTF